MMNAVSRDPQLPRNRSRSQAIVHACWLEEERRDFNIVVLLALRRVSRVQRGPSLWVTVRFAGYFCE
jgi:hypothetical protein